jgi:Predicted glycosyltransferases
MLKDCLLAYARRICRPAFLKSWWPTTAPTPTPARWWKPLRSIMPACRQSAIWQSAATTAPAAARNCGWRDATADFIAFTDDDCRPRPEWLRNGLLALEQGADAAWGKLVMPVPEKPTDYEKDASNLAHAEFVTANCFCRKSALEQVGGFDERFRLAWREDSDLFFNLLNLDAKIVHAPAAVVVHPIRPAPWGVSLSQQHKILFDALLYKKHPAYYRARIRSSPPWNYYVITFSLILAVILAATGNFPGAGLAIAVWLGFTLDFILHRLHGTSLDMRHVAK